MDFCKKKRKYTKCPEIDRRKDENDIQTRKQIVLNFEDKNNKRVRKYFEIFSLKVLFHLLIQHIEIFSPYKLGSDLGSGRGSVDRAVASDTRGPRIESNKPQMYHL